MTDLEQLLSDTSMPDVDANLISQLVTLANDDFLVVLLRYSIVEIARRMAIGDSEVPPSGELIMDTVQRVISLTVESTKK